MKDAVNGYQVYQDGIELWEYAKFKKVFRRQIIGEVYEDDVTEELRACYQGLKEKVALFLTKLRRIIVHLKRPPSHSGKSEPKSDQNSCFQRIFKLGIFLRGSIGVVIIYDNPFPLERHTCPFSHGLEITMRQYHLKYPLLR